VSLPLRLAETPEHRGPAAPRSLEDTGVPFRFLAELACKVLFVTGPQRMAELASRLKLPPSVLEPVVDFLRRDRLCEVAPGSTGPSLVFTLTGAGRARAEDYLRANQYAGPAPVSLDSYTEQARRQSLMKDAITKDDVQRAFNGVVVRDDILDQFGAAMNSGRAMFVYGPSGSGKTYLAERLVAVLCGETFVPYAILAADQVVQVFDPHMHERAATQEPGTHGLGADARWVACRRPVVVAGGELTLGMLELQFEPSARFYAAPLQIKANGGLLIIDDLGRQRVQPHELMNRWIVPLERRMDYLALHTGEKLKIPFEVTVVFSTNLAPAELADEAFLRRLGYKIYVGPVDEPSFRRLCRQACGELGIAYSEPATDYLVARLRSERRPLLACTPFDLFAQVRDRARYLGGVAAQPSNSLLDWAWHNYFFQPDPLFQGP
jgi:predicted ATPase with chaperone activity